MIVVAARCAGGRRAGRLDDRARRRQFKWFYWIGFDPGASLVLWLLATVVGYYMRVIRPKHRGREARDLGHRR